LQMTKIKRLDDDLPNKRGSEHGQPQGRIASFSKKALADAYASATGRFPSHRASSAPMPCGNSTARNEVRPERIAAGSEEAHSTGLVEGAAADSPPINNMGVTITLAKMGLVNLVMSDTGDTKQIMVRIPAAGQCAVIDWVNFTVLEDTWFKTARQTLISDEEILLEASRFLEKIFGFGITLNRNSGMNLYRNSWLLGENFGFVCFGGQRQTMLITLNGHGCANAIEGWEKRLYQFLTEVAVRPAITRIDLAHDDLDGGYLSVDWAEKKWHDGGYTMATGGQPPSIERIGNWHRPSGKGRTLTIGRRISGKFTRFYEKGKKEGDKLSAWLRCEVEYKSSDRLIPFNVLLAPSDYFAATYPCFAEFTAVDTPERIMVKHKTAVIMIDAAIEITKHQFGKYLRIFRDLYGDKEALDLVCNPDKDAWPKRIKQICANAETSPTPIHRQEKPFVMPFINFIQSVASCGLNAENGFPMANYT
jgi:phage replication initiation protein